MRKKAFYLDVKGFESKAREREDVEVLTLMFHVLRWPCKIAVGCKFHKVYRSLKFLEMNYTQNKCLFD